MKAGWTVKHLGGVLKLEYGKPLPKEDRAVDGKYPAYGANGAKCRTNKFYRDVPSIIVGRKGSAGEVNLTEEKFWPLDVTYFVDFDASQYELMFLYYFLESKNLQSLAKGVKPGINRNDVYAIEFAFPPLPEQKRIVAILDEAFAGISQAVANAEKNLANARELFESYLNNVFTQKGEGWVKTTLGDEIDLLTGFAFKSKSYTESRNGIQLVRGDNIVQGSFRWDNVKKWPKEDSGAYTQYFLEENDVVLAMDRTWVKSGLKFSQVSKKDLPCLLVQRVARLRAGSELDNRFLMHIIGSPEFTYYVLSIQTGLGVPHISGKQIKDFKFLRPSISVQKITASTLDELAENTQRIKTIYQQKLTALAELKQSILQKAFAGELTVELQTITKEGTSV